MTKNPSGKWRYISPSHIRARIAERGVLWCFRCAFVRITNAFLRMVAIPLAYPLAALNVRSLPIDCLHALGHLVLEPDCYLKEGLLGKHPRYYTILLGPKNRVANLHLLNYWRKYLLVINNPVACWFLEPLLRRPIVRYEIVQYAMNEFDTAQMGRVYAEWGHRPPLLELTEEDERRGCDWLRQMGMPADAWFVCVHAREPGNRMHDEDSRQRNVDIASYRLAMETIIARGGWCIRMGDPYMKPLPLIPHVIDYAHYADRQPWIDIFLCARCRFLLGSDSGLFHLAGAFGVPSAVANLIPLCVLSPGIDDVVLHKKMWSQMEGRQLTWSEIFNSPVATFHRLPMYEAADIRIIDNSPEEINELALEMLERTNGTAVYTEEDELLQCAFKAFYRPGYYSHGFGCRIGREMLRRHANELHGVETTKDCGR